MGTSDGTTIVCVGTSGWSLRRSVVRVASSSCPPQSTGRSAIGDVMALPPSTCTWAWKTVWPASGPVLTTSR